jgi:hypothetical protein
MSIQNPFQFASKCSKISDYSLLQFRAVRTDTIIYRCVNRQELFAKIY